MGIDALTRTDTGQEASPSTADDWLSWVSATATRNYTLGDPLLDWLNLYGSDHGFERDDHLPGYDPRTDFTQFIFEQGNRFEVAVVEHLRTLTETTAVASERGDARKLELAKQTIDLMREGTPVIYQGVLWDAQHRTYGVPDLLVRSDVLVKLFPDCMREADLNKDAPDLDLSGFHYRVIDAKFTTLHFSAKGELGNDGSTPAYKVQLFLYNRALGRLQGYEPEVAYLLGRGWEQTSKGVTGRGFTCLERLAEVGSNGTLAKKRSLVEAADEACDWIRDVRANGATWFVAPNPTRLELYPNLGNLQDGPWHAAKRRIAEDLEDLTLLWQVGVPGRALGHEAGIFRWRDERCTPAAVGVSGDSRPAVLQALMDINRSVEGPALRPEHVRAAEAEWRPVGSLEFYVDFETVNDLAD